MYLLSGMSLPLPMNSKRIPEGSQKNSHYFENITHVNFPIPYIPLRGQNPCLHINFEGFTPSTIDNDSLKQKYRMRAIITRGLYTFYPLFEVHLCTVTFGLMYG
jgi:hypothetical protein